MQNNLSIFLLSLRFILAILLYAFLAYSIFILWNNFKNSLSPISKIKTPLIHLSYKDKKISFQQQEIFLGRSPTSDLQIDNNTVSSSHAKIFFSKNQWWVEDMQSSNGSRLNSLDLTIPTVLTNEDELELGNATILISI